MSPQPGSWQSPLIVCGDRKVLCFHSFMLIFTYSFLYLTSAAPAVHSPRLGQIPLLNAATPGQVVLAEEQLGLVARTEARNLEALGLCPSYVSH